MGREQYLEAQGWYCDRRGWTDGTLRHTGLSLDRALELCAAYEVAEQIDTLGVTGVAAYLVAQGWQHGPSGWTAGAAVNLDLPTALWTQRLWEVLP